MRTILAVVVTVFLFVAGVAHAADDLASAADLQKLQDQLGLLDKDLAVLKEVSAARLDAQDKRLSDIGLTTAQQANQMSAISNQTTTVGNYIAMTSVLITILVFAAGFITYLSAKNRAEQEAREASKKWFNDHSTDLQAEIETLKKQAEAAVDKINTHTKEAADASAHAVDHAKASEKQVQEAAAKLINRSISSTEPAQPVDALAKSTIEQANVELTRKPEANFTHEDHYTRSAAHFSKGNYQSALESLESALGGAVVNELTTAKYLFAKAVTLGRLNRIEEEISVYDQIEQRYGKDKAPSMRVQVVKALFNKGFTLGTLKRADDAVAVFDQIEQCYGKDEASAMREQVVKALVNKGVTLCRLTRDDDAIAVCDQIEQRYGEDMAPAMRELVARALFNKGVTLGRLTRDDDAIAMYDQIEQRYSKDEALAMREQVVKALVNKGNSLGALNRTDEAIAVYDQIEQRYGKDGASAMRVLVARALFNKGVMLGRLTRDDEAIAVYDQIEQCYIKDEAPAMREQVARALVNKGVTLGRLDRAEEEIAVYDQIEQRYGKDEAPVMCEQAVRALLNKGVTLGRLNRVEEEIAVYDQVEQRYGKDEAPAMREQVARALNGASFERIMLAKAKWADGQGRAQLLARAQADLARGLEYGTNDDRSMMLGNLGYALFLQGQGVDAREATLECLKLGGQAQLDGQRNDARRHRIEPDDSSYELMLDELWRCIPSRTGALTPTTASATPPDHSH